MSTLKCVPLTLQVKVTSLSTDNNHRIPERIRGPPGIIVQVMTHLHLLANQPTQTQTHTHRQGKPCVSVVSSLTRRWGLKGEPRRFSTFSPCGHMIYGVVNGYSCEQKLYRVSGAQLSAQQMLNPTHPRPEGSSSLPPPGGQSGDMLVQATWRKLEHKHLSSASAYTATHIKVIRSRLEKKKKCKVPHELLECRRVMSGILIIDRLHGCRLLLFTSTILVRFCPNEQLNRYQREKGRGCPGEPSPSIQAILCSSRHVPHPRESDMADELAGRGWRKTFIVLVLLPLFVRLQRAEKVNWQFDASVALHKEHNRLERDTDLYIVSE